MKPSISTETATVNTDSLQIYFSTEETWEAMYEACSNAKKSIRFEQYILENDSCGQRFMELFAEKAAAGIDVFILCDKFGSASLYNSEYAQKLIESGGRIHFYNPIGWIHLAMPWRWFPRTHVKTLLIDSEIAFTGGVCLAERMRDWRDTHIRMVGSVTQQIAQTFTEVEENIKQGRRISHRSHKPTPIDTSAPCCYIITRPYRFRNQIYRTFTHAILNAKESIYISSAFFIPNRRFVKLLQQMTRRGVKIHILVPEHSDTFLADWIFLSYAQELLDWGINIYRYKKNVLHCKSMVIDDNWFTIGSTNMDIISFFYNREANLICTDPKTAIGLNRQFIIDLEHSSRLTSEHLRQLPLWKKVAGYCGRLPKFFVQKAANR